MHRVVLKRPEVGVAHNGSDHQTRKLTRSFDWRTTDQEEIELRQLRARGEQPSIRNLDYSIMMPKRLWKPWAGSISLRFGYCRKSRIGSNSGGDEPNALFYAASMRRRCRRESTRSTRQKFRCFRISAKECCISHLTSGRSWPMRWVWARPFRSR
jgi:hypothetical protein